MCNFYKNSNYDDTYVLVGILEEQGDISGDALKEALEEHIAENLELFENTEFYKHRVHFVYEKSVLHEATGDRLVFGKLTNNRLGLKLLFYGYYIEVPMAYVFGICKEEGQLDVIKNVIDGAIAAYMSKNSDCEEND